MNPSISVTHLGDPSPGGPKARGLSAVPALPSILLPVSLLLLLAVDRYGRARLGPLPCAPRGGQWRASEPRDPSPHLHSRRLQAAGPACQQGRACHGMTGGCQQHLFAEQSRQPLSVDTVPSPAQRTRLPLSPVWEPQEREGSVDPGPSSSPGAGTPQDQGPEPTGLAQEGAQAPRGAGRQLGLGAYVSENKGGTEIFLFSKDHSGNCVGDGPEPGGEGGGAAGRETDRQTDMLGVG